MNPKAPQHASASPLSCSTAALQCQEGEAWSQPHQPSSALSVLTPLRLPAILSTLPAASQLTGLPADGARCSEGPWRLLHGCVQETQGGRPRPAGSECQRVRPGEEWGSPAGAELQARGGTQYLCVTTKARDNAWVWPPPPGLPSLGSDRLQGWGHTREEMPQLGSAVWGCMGPDEEQLWAVGRGRILPQGVPGSSSHWPRVAEGLGPGALHQPRLLLS